MVNILFVCTGNTCRSPMAEALLKNKQCAKFSVKSAGIFAANGSDASAFAKEVLSEKGICHDHKSSPLTSDMIEWATYILTMTNGHKDLIKSTYPEADGKTFTLKEFVRGDKGDIIDPFGGTKEAYQQTLNELDELIGELLDKEGV